MANPYPYQRGYKYFIPRQPFDANYAYSTGPSALPYPPPISNNFFKNLDDYAESSIMPLYGGQQITILSNSDSNQKIKFWFESPSSGTIYIRSTSGTASYSIQYDVSINDGVPVTYTINENGVYYRPISFSSTVSLEIKNISYSGGNNNISLQLIGGRNNFAEYRPVVTPQPMGDIQFEYLDEPVPPPTPLEQKVVFKSAAVRFEFYDKKRKIDDVY